MKSFNEFLLEENTDTKKGKLVHLRHVEDNVLYDGHEGVARAGEHLDAVHKSLLGKKSGVHVSTKYDGSPSLVWGRHPETKQFFVASKSAFNKTPKINYTHEDIEKNHGHAPGLVEKLKAGLDHLPKITPSHGVYQGDLLHTKGDAKTEKGMTSITPNTITYSAPKDSVEGTNMRKKLGVVVHTHYKGGNKLESMNAGPLDANARKEFKEHPDVNNVDPTLHINPKNYTPQEQKAYLDHMENAKRAYGRMKPEATEALEGHGPAMEAHVNEMVRSGGEPSVDGYKNSITSRHLKDVEKVATDAAKSKKIQGHAAAIQYVNENKDHFRNALELHSHLQKAKNVLTGVMAKNNKFSHSIGGIPTGPEGSVVISKDGAASKFVDRAEFSRNNFLKGAYQKKQQEENNER